MKVDYRVIGLIIIVLGALFFPGLPSTVQMGDTGELVRSAYAFEVPHPPGYPLFTYLNAAAIKLIPQGTVFWRASALTSVFAIGCCVLLFLMFTENIVLGLLLVLTLATSRLFWRFAVLPDVFALHSSIVAVILLIYLNPKFKKFEMYIPMLFLIGLSHHLTLVFIAPIIVHVGLRHIRNLKMWIAAGIGFIFTIGAYALLSFLNPENLDSWGQLTNTKAILSHFLRSDYGTFKLVGTSESGSFLVLLNHLLTQTIKSFGFLILASLPLIYLRTVKYKSFPLKECLVAASIVLYISIFFYLSNTTLDGFRKETFERFFIFFHVMFSFWLCNHFIAWKTSRRNYLLAGIVLTVGIVYNVANFYKLNNFSENTIIEDYAINLLNQTEDKKTSVLLAMTDTRYGALKYAQTVLGVRKDVLVIHPRLLFFSWYLKKIPSRGLSLDSDKIINTNQLVLEQDVIVRNLQEFTFLTHLNFTDAAKYKIEIVPLGRKLVRGSGIEFKATNDALKLRATPANIFDSAKDYNVFYDLWTDYGHYYYFLALAQVSTDPPAALATLQKLVELVPWHFAAHKKICELQNTEASKCDEAQKKRKDVFFDYY